MIVLPILLEIQEIRGAFTSFNFSFVNRKANFAAHYLAKVASVSSPDCVWLDQAPVMLAPSIQQDRSLADESI